jgi:two-component response regulator (ARR-A family)
LLLARSRCLNAGAEDFIVKPLQSKDVQRLRNCSTAARPSSKGGAAPCEATAVAKRNSKPLVLPPSAVACATSPSGRRANLAGVAMVRRPLTLTLTATPVPWDG